MSKHTPGPWHIERVYVDGADRIYVESRSSGSICKVAYKVNGVEYANASLLAAAPEMYELLEAFANYYHARACPGKGEHFSLCNRAQQVIAKVEGRP